MRKYIGSFADGALEMLRTPACGRRMLGLVTAGFILLLATGVTSLWMSARTNDLLTRVEHTLQVRATLNDLAESIANAETHQRGFLLTGQSQFLGEYRQAHDRTLAALETIRLLVSDDPEQLVRIETLRPVVERRLEVASQSLEAARRGETATAMAIVRRGEGIIAMREARAGIAALDAAEAAQLEGRQAATRRASSLNIWVNLIGTFLVVLIAGACLVLFWRYVRDIQTARETLDRLNRGLEDQVRERTAALVRANEEIQRFAYIVSHDLRAPLVNVMGYTSELEQSGKALTAQVEALEAKSSKLLNPDAVLAVREDMPEAIGFIRASTQKMDRLITAILKLSREGRRALTPERLDMAAMAQGIADSVHHQIEESGTVIAIGNLPWVESDRLSMEQIVGNLIDNALKYLDPERPGRIEITGEDTFDGSVVYRITDNGRGISDRDHERIFELFRRSGRQDRPGEGLGLAFVRNSVRRLEGDIRVESELGKGSTFVLKFPKRLVVIEGSEAA